MVNTLRQKPGNRKMPPARAGLDTARAGPNKENRITE
jgi:hypothetical protein